MKRALIAVAVLAALFCTSSSRAQSGTYTQKVDVEGRSGELNFYGAELYDSSGTLRGNYSLVCNSNAINTITCKFYLTLDSVMYAGKVTQVTTYFPFPPGYHGSNGGPGPFAYEWSVSTGDITLTGSSQGTGKWVSGGCHTCGYVPVIEAGATVTVN